MPFLSAIDTMYADRVNVYATETGSRYGSSLVWEYVNHKDANKHISTHGDRLTGLTLQPSCMSSGAEKTAILNVDLRYLPENLESLVIEGDDSRHRNRVVFAASRKETNLEYLAVRGLNLTNIEVLFDSVSSSTVEIWGCSLKGGKLPSSVWNPKMADLKVKNTSLRRLPVGMENAESLAKMEIGECGLMELPVGIKKLSELQYLECDGNKLREIPEMPESLRSAAFRWNLLREIPDWAYLRSMYVNIHGNPIATNGHKIRASKGTFKLAATASNIRGTLDLEANLIAAVPPWMEHEKLADDPISEDNGMGGIGSFGSKILAVSPQRSRS